MPDPKPDAPKGDTEIKVCPFCGKTPSTYTTNGIPSKFVWCNEEDCKGDLPVENWNSAWAHKQIAALKQEIESQKHCYRLLDEHREELGQENKSLKEQVDRLKDLVSKNYQMAKDFEEITGKTVEQNKALKQYGVVSEDNFTPYTVRELIGKLNDLKEETKQLKEKLRNENAR